ncbi:hypothetical protein N7281_00190 [Rickettsia hoogstraalii]|nr:hypothetical protein [Rickettsia hoogstraalii]MCX4083335.1 hypothetical protein [Rickettsia hoogstraalii]
MVKPRYDTKRIFRSTQQRQLASTVHNEESVSIQQGPAFVGI